jgi:hypothetical protein
MSTWIVQEGKVYHADHTTDSVYLVVSNDIYQGHWLCSANNAVSDLILNEIVSSTKEIAVGAMQKWCEQKGYVIIGTSTMLTWCEENNITVDTEVLYM